MSGTTTDFCLTCHSETAITAVRTSTSVVPYTVGFTSYSADSVFSGWSKTGVGTDFRASGHFATTGTKALCETCHDPHGSNNRALAAWTKPASFVGGVEGTRDNTSSAAFEENLCLQCHGDGTLGRQADQAAVVTMGVDAIYGHNVSTSGKHSDSETPADTGSKRHAECVDCHNPHAAQPGTHAAGSTGAAPVLRGATGIVPSWADQNWSSPSTFTAMQITGLATDSEAFVCFKCHSQASGQPSVAVRSNGSTYTSTDLPLEFNPANASFHNVLGLSTGMKTSFDFGNGFQTTWSIYNPELIFKSGWNQNSKVTCSDCHTAGVLDQARGPHGASVPFIVDPQYTGDWKTARLMKDMENGTDQPIICNKCHADYTKMNRPHSATSYWGGTSLVHWGDTCVTCHIRIPHGWKRPRLLGYPTDPAPYTAGLVQPWGSVWGSYGIRDSSKSQMGWSASDCSASCSSTHRSMWNPNNKVMP
jgi:predicted CXXCH cytochrome family protein